MAKICDRGLIVKKIGMSRIYDENGKILPVTLLQVENQKVTKVLTPDRDGYHGYQVGYYEKLEKKLNKPDILRLRKVGVEQNYASFCEFRTDAQVNGVEVGSPLKAEWFQNISYIDITGVTKGKGFQGSVKRWGTAIGRMTHGSRFHRRPGSLGQRSSPGRVFKNKPQPGHMGDVKQTVLNLQIVKIDAENNLIVVKGSVPGHRKGFLEVRPARQFRVSGS